MFLLVQAARDAQLGVPNKNPHTSEVCESS